MEYPYPTPDPPFRPGPVPASDAGFPVRTTARAGRALASYLAGFRPYGGPCLRVTMTGPGEPLLTSCDRCFLADTPHLRSTFGRTPVGVPVGDAAGLAGCVIDFRSFPPGPPTLYTHPLPGGDEPSAHPARVPLSLPKLKALHPELFRPASAVTKAARAVLSVTALFAETDGNPGWPGRLVGEDDSGGQAEAVEAIARGLWAMPVEAAVVVSAEPAVVAVTCVGFDHVVLLRLPETNRLAAGDRLLSCNGYETNDSPQSDIRHGPRSFHVRNWVWPVLADPLTDDAARLAALKAEVRGAEWERVRRLGEERLAAGDRPRDGRPWLARVEAADQGKGWWRRAGGYLR